MLNNRVDVDSFRAGAICLALAGIVGLFIILGHDARVDEPTDPDVRIHHAIAKVRVDWPGVTRGLRFLTRFGDWPVAAPVTLITLFTILILSQRVGGRVTGPAVFVGLIAILAAQGLSVTLKRAVGRERPPIENRLVVENAPSFPSGHSVFAGSFLTTLVLLGRRLNASSRLFPRHCLVGLCGLFAFTLGFSRVWLGVHYPSDVVGGLILGVFTTLGVWLTFLGIDHSTGKPLIDAPGTSL